MGEVWSWDLTHHSPTCYCLLEQLLNSLQISWWLWWWLCFQLWGSCWFWEAAVGRWQRVHRYWQFVWWTDTWTEWTANISRWVIIQRNIILLMGTMFVLLVCKAAQSVDCKICKFILNLQSFLYVIHVYCILLITVMVMMIIIAVNVVMLAVQVYSVLIIVSQVTDCKPELKLSSFVASSTIFHV